MKLKKAKFTSTMELPNMMMQDAVVAETVHANQVAVKSSAAAAAAVTVNRRGFPSS